MCNGVVIGDFDWRSRYLIFEKSQLSLAYPVNHRGDRKEAGYPFFGSGEYAAPQKLQAPERNRGRRSYNDRERRLEEGSASGLMLLVTGRAGDRGTRTHGPGTKFEFCEPLIKKGYSIKEDRNSRRCSKKLLREAGGGTALQEPGGKRVLSSGVGYSS